MYWNDAGEDVVGRWTARSLLRWSRHWLEFRRLGNGRRWRIPMCSDDLSERRLGNDRRWRTPMCSDDLSERLLGWRVWAKSATWDSPRRIVPGSFLETLQLRRRGGLLPGPLWTGVSHGILEWRMCRIFLRQGCDPAIVLRSFASWLHFAVMSCCVLAIASALFQP